MPANLNALIRYKTINSCLYGGKRRWSIRELIDACSEALADARGRYEPISERTIRDDLRVMKSDILGFNAPIEQAKGLYFYSDPHFSILTLKITDAGLADNIYSFLIGLRTEIQHPELESILEQLCKLTQKPYVKPVSKEWIKNVQKDEVFYSADEYASKSNKLEDIKSFKLNISGWINNFNDDSPITETQPPKKVELLWGEILAHLL